MSTGSHLTSETQTLIKDIGESRSKQDEDALIKKDIDKLKKIIHDTPYEKMAKDTKLVREIAIRAIYADMLGHDVSFTHFFLINMTNSKNLHVKRAGYLACWLLLGEDNDLKIMLVATLQRDMKSESAYEVLIALNSLNKLISPANVNNLDEDAMKHLNHSNPLIRKKAFCLMQKIYRINPKRLPKWDSKIREGLGDAEPSVMGVCLNLYYEELQSNPTKHKDVVKILVTILNLILDVKLPRDYDFQRIPAPWMQIRILQIFGIICQNDKKTSEEVYNVVEKTLRRSDDTMTDIGYAVTFQAIKTITKLYANQHLLEKASKTIGKFFMAQPANSKINKINLYYMGIESMRSLVNINPEYAAEHKVHVVDCLQHPDESIRRPTLDLLYKTTNTENLDVVMDKLIVYLKSTNEERFKHDLVLKIYELIERLSPNPDWFIRNTNILFMFGSECITDSMLSGTIKIIEENLATDTSGEFGGLLIQSYYEYIEKQIPPQMVKLICWIFAEVGFKLYANDSTSLDQLVESVIHLSKLKNEGTTTKNWVLSSLAKLSSCPGFQNQNAKNILKELQESQNPEIKQRAYEYFHCPGGIQNITQIENYDYNLSFLKDTIVKAVEMGMAKYDPAKLNVSLVASKPEIPIELLTQHREVKIDKEDVKKDAFEDDDPKLKADPKKNLFFKKGGEEQAGSKPSIDPVKIFQNPQEKKSEVPEVQQQKVDKREKAANKIFGATSGSMATKLSNTNQKKPTFLKPGTSKTTENQAQGSLSTGTELLSNPIAPQKTSPTNPTAEQNLLDLDFGEPSNPQTPSENRTPANSNQPEDLLSGLSTPVQQTQPKPTGGSKFIKPTFKAPVVKPSSLTPYPITEEQYEDYWNKFTIDRKQNVKSMNVRTQTEFNQLAKTVGFNITSTIDTDNICAAKYGDHIVLFYGKFKMSGEVEVMLNSSNQEAVEFALDSIKKYCSR